ncbi:MAG: NAD-dependent deacylase [bacterium]
MVERIAESIARSQPAVALTGAGHSTPSGIPDFRSPGTGLWDKIDPMEVASIHGFMANPAKFYRFMAPLSEMVKNSKPNPAHYALAELGEMGLLKSVITQNIDNLHQEAGSKNVIELHGSGETGTCMNCGKNFPRADFEPLLDAESVPRCDGCGGVIKPDVVLFGEALPYEALMQAQKDSESCGVMLVVGSSLTVAPASMLPQLALRAGAKVSIINLQSTYMDPHAYAVLHEKLEEAVPAIVERVKEKV